MLDVGCAGGYLGATLSARGYQVVGIDLPGVARAAFPESVEFVEADLDLCLPPLAGPFDFVICADVLEHLKRPDRLLGALHGLLSKRGTLVASLPNSGHAYFRWNVLRGRFPAEERGLFDRTHLHFYTWHGWMGLVASAGFQIESFRCSGVPIGLALPMWEDTRIVRALERLSYVAARAWKSLFAYQFIVTGTPV